MVFQTPPLRSDQTTGLPGELAREGPLRASDWIINSSGITDNVIGAACTKVSDGVVRTGGTGAFIGFLSRPKEHALIGTGSSALLASDVLADLVNVTLITMGILFIQLDGSGGAGTVTSLIYFDDITGAIGAGSPGAGQTAIAGATIVLEDVAADGLAIVQLTI